MANTKPNLAGIQSFRAAAYIKLENAANKHRRAVLSAMIVSPKVTGFIGLKSVWYPSNAMLSSTQKTHLKNQL